ncbi:MAG: metal-binding protein [Rhodocyclaceae bacterium]|nr:MAG: metal-binding protein [Rhodocyclaceae bacterium]
MIAFAPFMSDQPTQDLAGVVLNTLDFARDSRFKAGHVAVQAMERLADVLLSSAGLLQCELRGERDEQGDSFLCLWVQGELTMRCQRCLEPMQYQLRVASRLRLMPPGAEWPEDELEDDSADAIEAKQDMALLPLIEEEVLLALPIAPTHESCEPPASRGKDQESSPFAVLAKLKNKV